MKELIERIEGASGPSRELDAEIAVAKGWSVIKPDWFVPPNSTVAHHASELPHYTASLDAAMTLVPEGEGRWPQLYYTGPNPNNSRQGHRWQIWIKGRGSPHFGHSQHSSALALAAAALKVRGE